MKAILKVIALLGFLITVLLLGAVNVAGATILTRKDFIIISTNMMLQLFVYCDILGFDTQSIRTFVVEKLNELKEIVK